MKNATKINRIELHFAQGTNVTDVEQKTNWIVSPGSQ